MSNDRKLTQNLCSGINQLLIILIFYCFKVGIFYGKELTSDMKYRWDGAILNFIDEDKFSGANNCFTLFI